MSRPHSMITIRAEDTPARPDPSRLQPGKVRGGLVTVRDAALALAGRGVDFTHQPLGRHIDATGLAGYYCDFRHKARAASAHDDGFPRRTSTGCLLYTSPSPRDRS